MKSNKVCILGGTGFVGRHLAHRLAGAGIECLIPSRNPERHRGTGYSPNIRISRCNLFDSGQLVNRFNGCDAVINLVGILNESGDKTTFQRMHVELTDRVIEACRASGVSRLLHMSALNADAEKGPSQYLRTKGEAERRAHSAAGENLKVTSFRPSVIFGRDDSFFNRFAGLLKMLPGPFPLACADARFAPVYVGDVAQAFAASLNDSDTWGESYPLCGPRTFTLKELVEYTARQLKLWRPVIPLDDRVARLQARILERVPGKPFSRDNYLSLQVDSVCSADGLVALGIRATDIDTVVPYYLAGRSERGRYNRLRQCRDDGCRDDHPDA
jgi:uncharacterized protein YbjT (DUF2867 family)